MSAHVSRSEKKYSICYANWFLCVANFHCLFSYIKTNSSLLYFLLSRHMYILKYVEKYRTLHVVQCMNGTCDNAVHQILIRFLYIRFGIKLLKLQ
jgi:hypothetical protein